MRLKFVLLAAISSLVVAIDQLTKMYVHTHYQLGESTTVINGFFNITYVRNFGAAFGFLAESHPMFREVFFLAMPPTALMIIILILKSIPEKDRAQIWALSAVFGGALGNYIDRIRFRYVIDFLDFHLNSKLNWPAFNIADSAIVVGVATLLFFMLKEEGSSNKKNNFVSTEAPKA